MNTLIKPPRLRPGDRIATVSPSWGCAGSPDARWRYELGVQRLKSEFGLEAAAMSHSLKGEDYLDTHPEARAEDLMTAFADPSIKGILANIGGSDSLRLLPYMDFDVIHNHPKVFIGYSDITSVHLMCLHAGLSTFYGANLLTTIADPQGLHPYSKHWFQKALFDVEPIGFIPPPDTFTCDSTDEPNPNQIKQYHPCKGYECLQGHGKVTGRLFGGVGGDTVTVGWSTFSQSPLLAPFEENDDILLFIDDIVDYLSPQVYIDLFRWLHEKGITQNLKGVLFGRLNEYPENPAYKTALLQVMNELDLSHLPILYNLPFGHTNPICALPFGALAEINCDNVTFAILESGVV